MDRNEPLGISNQVPWKSTRAINLWKIYSGNFLALIFVYSVNITMFDFKNLHTGKNEYSSNPNSPKYSLIQLCYNKGYVYKTSCI